MTKSKPNIHILELYNRYYMYDAGTNAIFSITKEMCRFLMAILNSNGEIEVGDELKEEIEYLKESGCLKPVDEKIVVEHGEISLLESLYENNLNTIILQVTQNCNLRCQYCVYSGSYINRVHNNKRMSVEVAKQAIDFLVKHSENSKEISIGFYGGEPLLEVPLIREVIDYAEGVFSGKKLLFNMTTNATLLNIETAKYLYEKKFNVTISLDGPKATHDSNRIFANSNKGTFDAVMQNLELIRKELPGFIKNIGFNAVIDLKQNVACSSEFFLNYETVKGINVASNYINPISKKDEEPINPELIAISYYEIFKTYLYACNKEIFSNYKPTLYSSEVASLKQIVKDRFVGLQTYQGKISPGGQCLPGIQRFFVTVDGKFFPCERVDEESSELCIGDLKNGFDLENAKKILNVAKITEKECRECWCYKMCSQCVAKAGENGKIEAANRLKWCKQSRENAEEYIKNYIVLKNFGCKFEEGEA